MRLPSHLVKNRFGVFYFRITFPYRDRRIEKRWSLNTKNPAVAKYLALKLTASLFDNTGRLIALPQISAELIDLAQWTGEIKQMIERNTISLVTSLSDPKSGLRATVESDSSDPKDVEAGERMVRQILREYPDMIAQISAGSSENSINQSLPGMPVESICPLPEVIKRYKKRKAGEIAPKTLYENSNMQTRFAYWIADRFQNMELPISLITRGVVSEYIDHLKSDGISLQTVQKKHLAAIAGLFDLAITMGAYPKGNNPANEHKIFNRRDKKKASALAGWLPFSKEDLESIFLSSNLLQAEKPCDFWLPLLGLFTGGRIQELCQLRASDIKNVQGIWSIDINAEDGNSVKTIAGIRTIPLHPVLIGIGFLEYVDDIKQYEGTIFPYLTPDRFGNYTKTPSRRFGDYLTKVGILEQRKVFHSFRSTSNDRLKQNGVPEESRCQFIGHEHDTVNSTSYSKEHGVQFLLDNVASKLVFPNVDFSQLKYPRAEMQGSLSRLMNQAKRKQAHKAAKEQRNPPA